MHSLSVQTRFTFGDRVRFDSLVNRCTGIGTVVAIEVWSRSTGGPPITYFLDIDGEEDGLAGILEDEMTLLEPASRQGG